ASPQTLGSFIAGFGSAGTATYVNGGGAVDPNQQVLTAGFWVVDKEIESFTNDLRFSKDLFEGNTLTAGVYFARYSSKDTWYLGTNML
ncbi:TonB-dependent receptor, partial [Lysobacter sp. 2RAB21]